MRAVRLTQDQWAEARRLRETLALSIAEIAARFGVSQHTVRRHAEVGGWLTSPGTASSPKRTRLRNPRSVVGRRQLVKRLYKAMDTKLRLMERRMEAQMTNLDQGKDLTSADHERDARAFGAMIKNIEQVKEMQADLDRVAGGQPATAADAELFAEADRFRREIAERLARFIPPAG
jgi:DNA-binding transcriptional MerR regulator